MKKRCNYPNASEYENYGGRGISVCEEWSNSFQNFYNWAINNGWSKGLTIDRIENDKGYCPANCRWVTRLQQCYNKTNNILYNYGGTEIPLGMIAKLENVKYGRLYLRVRQKGMSVRQALEDIKGGN